MIKNIYSYIDSLKDEDRFVARRILDLVSVVKESRFYRSTDFLSHNEALIARSVLNYFKDVEYIETGLSINAERKVFVISSGNIVLEDLLTEIFSMLEIRNLPGAIIHRDVLGSLLSLGINRSKVGDIFFVGRDAYIIIKKEMETFLLENFDQIGNHKITVDLEHIKNGHDLDHSYKSFELVVSSLRIDNVVSSIVNTSRSKSLILIDKGSVKLNGITDLKKNQIIVENDVFSIRGLGKFKFTGVKGNTKKGNLILQLKEYI
ncbi:MAG: YlmH/Sll1252 family protein [Eubacteriales bacterium]|nr:YlmH/Sll1252 family protein [Eubacteriales bacterium]